MVQHVHVHLHVQCHVTKRLVSGNDEGGSKIFFRTILIGHDIDGAKVWLEYRDAVNAGCRPAPLSEIPQSKEQIEGSG